MGSPWAAVLSGSIHLLQPGPVHRLQRNSCFYHSLFHGVQEIPALLWSLPNLPWAAGESLLQANLCSGPWVASFPLFFPDLGVHRTVSHTFCSFIFCLCDFFLPFLKYVLPEVVPVWLKGALCPTAGLLEPAGAGCASPGHPCSTASRPTLPCELKTCRQIVFAKIQLDLKITLRTRKEMVLLLPFHVVWGLDFGSQLIFRRILAWPDFLTNSLYFVASLLLL